MTDTTRDAFEAWFTKRRSAGMLGKSETGGYEWVATSEAFEVWQAATEQGKRQPLTFVKERAQLEQEWCELRALTAASKRQPLTNDELGKLWDDHTVPVFGKIGINPIVFARAIEAAHGITATPQGNP